jgi:hypothetical protein
MTKTLESDRAELIQALHRAARIERAETVLRLLRKLLPRGSAHHIPSCPALRQPAAVECR